MKKVSIIVPCYNHAEFIAETLDSVLSQTYLDWECVIVNDGSTDNTEEIVREYCKMDERFKYINQSNSGVSAARNRGINESEGYYILPLDGDDVIDPTYLEKAVRYFDDNPDTTIVYCKADFFGVENGPWFLPEYKYESIIWNNIIFVSALYKREDYNKTNGYNLNMDKGLEDWDFWLSMLDKNSIVYRIDEILFHYRIKERSRNVDASKSIDVLLRQIYFNHKSIYDTYICEIIKFHNDSIGIKMALDREHDKIKQIKESYSYRLGYFLLMPVHFIKKILNRNK